jgi:hypothetical protein
LNYSLFTFQHVDGFPHGQILTSLPAGKQLIHEFFLSSPVPRHIWFGFGTVVKSYDLVMYSKIQDFSLVGYLMNTVIWVGLLVFYVVVTIGLWIFGKVLLKG